MPMTTHVPMIAEEKQTDLMKVARQICGILGAERFISYLIGSDPTIGSWTAEEVEPHHVSKGAILARSKEKSAVFSDMAGGSADEVLGQWGGAGWITPPQIRSHGEHSPASWTSAPECRWGDSDKWCTNVPRPADPRRRHTNFAP